MMVGRHRGTVLHWVPAGSVVPAWWRPEPTGCRCTTMARTYTARDITVLEGLEPVRKRPGMYIGGVGSPGLHHLVWEILDNSVDEAMNGYAQNVHVTLHADRSSITVADDGGVFRWTAIQRIARAPWR